MEIKLKVNPSINFKAPATYNASPAHKPPQGIIQLKSNAADLRRIIPGFLKHAPNTTLANFGNFSKKFDYQLPVFDVRLRDKEDKKDKSQRVFLVPSRVKVADSRSDYYHLAEISTVISSRTNEMLEVIKANAYKKPFIKFGRKKLFHGNLRKEIADLHSGIRERCSSIFSITEQQMLHKPYESSNSASNNTSINLLNEVYIQKAISSKQAFIFTKQCFRKSLQGKRSQNVNKFFKQASTRKKLKEGQQQECSIKLKSQISQAMQKDLLSEKKYLSCSIQPSQSRLLFNKKYVPTKEESKSKSINKQYDKDLREWKCAKRKQHSPSKMVKTQLSTCSPQKKYCVPPKKITAMSYIVYQPWLIGNDRSQLDIKTKHNHKIHAGLNSKTLSQIASLTKIMTCIVVLDLLDNFQLNSEEQKVKISKFEANINGTSADLCCGQIYTVNQLMYGLMLPSGNDASLALAVWGGRRLIQNDLQSKPSQQPQSSTKPTKTKQQKFKQKRCYMRFLAQMNKKSRSLGMDKTSYANSHGLVNAFNKSCCYDLALLCQHAMRNDQFRKIVSCKIFQAIITKETNVYSEQPEQKIKQIRKHQQTDVYDDIEYQNQEQDSSEGQCPDNETTETEPKNKMEVKVTTRQVKWVNTHKLVQQDEEYLGIKTGVTTAAGPCLASCILSNNGRTFIIIVLNSKKLNHRFKDTEHLKKWLYKKQKIVLKHTNIQNQSDSVQQ